VQCISEWDSDEETTFLFVFEYIGVAQGLMFPRQVLCQLIYSASPFCFAYFGDRGLLFAPGGLDLDPLIYTALVAGMTGVHHHA
jgi:hypothetical protein